MGFAKVDNVPPKPVKTLLYAKRTSSLVNSLASKTEFTSNSVLTDRVPISHLLVRITKMRLEHLQPLKTSFSFFDLQAVYTSRTT